MHLFGKNHVDFDDCCYEAQKFDDNCDFGQLKKTSSLYASSKQGNNLDPYAIAKIIMRKMSLEIRNHLPNRWYPLRLYSCGTCGRSHWIETTNPLK